jgi:spermidine synthase
MASLLFVPRPERVLITGLGGGSLPRFCHRYMPEARISVVEISEEVIGLRSQFPLPEDDRLTIIQGDAMDFLASNRQQFDIVLLDAYQADGLPSGLVTPQFGRYTAAAVGANGVLIANLTGDSTRWNSHLRQLWAAFDRRIRVLPVPEEEGQYLALGFHAPELYRIPEQIEAHADALQQSTPLDFSALSSWVRGEGLEW